MQPASALQSLRELNMLTGWDKRLEHLPTCREGRDHSDGRRSKATR